MGFQEPMEPMPMEPLKNKSSNLEVEKKISHLAQFDNDVLWVSWTSRFFINLQLWPLIFLQSIDMQRCTVSHLKDLIHIYLEPEVQGCLWLLTCVMLAQSTLISYHTEAFIKTEVGCTVCIWISWFTTNNFLHKSKDDDLKEFLKPKWCGFLIPCILEHTQ